MLHDEPCSRFSVKRCKTASTNRQRAFHEKHNTEVSVWQRALTQLETSKDQSNICCSEGARYCVTVRNNLTAILFCTICEYRSQVKRCILRCNFTAQLPHIWRVVPSLGWKHTGCFHKSLLYCDLPCFVLCATHFISLHDASPFPFLQPLGAFLQAFKWKLGSEWAKTTVSSQQPVVLHTSIFEAFRVEVH